MAPSTHESYERYVRCHIRPALGHARLDELNSRLIQGFVNDLDRQKGLSASYIRLIHTCLRGILKLAFKWDLIPQNPADADRVNLPSPEQKERRILTKEEIAGFLTAAKEDRLYALFVLLATTGLRPQEAYGLKWKDLQDGWLRVRRVISKAPKEADSPYRVSDEMKTKSSKRRIKLDDFTLNALEEHRKRQAEKILQVGQEYERRGFIFARGPASPHPGRFIYQEYARRYFKPALRRAGLPAGEIRMYDLRHTCLSNLIMDGVDLKLVSSRAGHSSIQQTADTYAHLTDEAEEQMAAVTNQWLQRTG